MFEMGKYVSPSVRVCSLFALRSLGSWLRLTRSLSSTRRVRIALLCSRNAHALSRSASTRFRSCKTADRAIRDAAADAAFRQAGESTAGCSAGDIQGWHVADDDGLYAHRIPNSWELTRRKMGNKTSTSPIWVGGLQRVALFGSSPFSRFPLFQCFRIFFPNSDLHGFACLHQRLNKKRPQTAPGPTPDLS